MDLKQLQRNAAKANTGTDTPNGNVPRRTFLGAVGKGIMFAAALSFELVSGHRSAKALSNTLGNDELPALQSDPYLVYCRTSRDFHRVKQDKAWLAKSFPGWLYMPWTYQWTIGYTEASGAWSREHGFNGAFLDGNGGVPDLATGQTGMD